MNEQQFYLFGHIQTSQTRGQPCSDSQMVKQFDHLALVKNRTLENRYVATVKVCIGILNE